MDYPMKIEIYQIVSTSKYFYFQSFSNETIFAVPNRLKG
jgi:hypothetical protein